MSSWLQDDVRCLDPAMFERELVAWTSSVGEAYVPRGTAPADVDVRAVTRELVMELTEGGDSALAIQLDPDISPWFDERLDGQLWLVSPSASRRVTIMGLAVDD